MTDNCAHDEIIQDEEEVQDLIVDLVNLRGYKRWMESYLQDE